MWILYIEKLMVWFFGNDKNVMICGRVYLLVWFLSFGVGDFIEYLNVNNDKYLGEIF